MCKIMAFQPLETDNTAILIAGLSFLNNKIERTHYIRLFALLKAQINWSASLSSGRRHVQSDIEKLGRSQKTH